MPWRLWPATGIFTDCRIRAPLAPTWDACTVFGGIATFVKCELIGNHRAMTVYPISFSGLQHDTSTPESQVILRRCVVKHGTWEWHPHVTWYQYQGRPVCFSSKWMGQVAGIHRNFTSDVLHPPWSREAFQCYPSTDSCIRGSSACQTDDWRNSSSDHEPWSEEWAMCLEAWSRLLYWHYQLSVCCKWRSCGQKLLEWSCCSHCGSRKCWSSRAASGDLECYETSQVRTVEESGDTTRWRATRFTGLGRFWRKSSSYFEGGTRKGSCRASLAGVRSFKISIQCPLKSHIASGDWFIHAFHNTKKTKKGAVRLVPCLSENLQWDEAGC